jgi:hypothetical protein
MAFEDDALRLLKLNSEITELTVRLWLRLGRMTEEEWEAERQRRLRRMRVVERMENGIVLKGDAPIMADMIDEALQAREKYKRMLEGDRDAP